MFLKPSEVEVTGSQFHNEGFVKTSSLTRQIISIILITQLVCAIGLAGAALWHERRTQFRAFDIRLQGHSDSLLGAIQDAEDPGDTLKIEPAELKLPRSDVYAVYNRGGSLIGTSADAPPALIRRGEDGFRDSKADGLTYRVLQREALRKIDREESDGAGFNRPVTILYASPETHVWHEAMEEARFHLLTIAIAAVLAAFLVSILLRRTLRPLSALANAAASLSAPDLRFDPPPSALRIVELRPLAEVLTRVVERLREAFAKEHQFVGDAAHELKTAVAVVRSSVQVLMLKRRTVGEYEAGLDRVLEDTQRLEVLIAQMLQLVRLEGSSHAVLSRMDLADVVVTVADRLSPIAMEHDVEISVQALPESFVRLQPEAADILVSNLLHNAIQHSRPTTRVSISVARTESGAIRLRIADHGEGIGAEALPHIFDRFYREDRSRSRETGGTGLGLAICKSIVDAAGGTIHVESEKNIGTEVRVTFSSD
jgi:signal transduction histidine kinase